MNFRIFLVPFVLFFLAFFTDKLLYIGRFDDTFLRTATFLNYEHKVDMLDELDLYLRTPGRKKALVIFGNSRTMSFDHRYLEKEFPDWTWFNFSVPGGTTDYFYYLTTEFERRGIRPDAIVMTVTPQGFNATPAQPLDEVMISGLPVAFVIRNMRHFTTDDLMNYAAKKLFWNYRYRPKAEVILARLANNGQQLRIFRQFQYETGVRLRESRGSVSFQFQGIPAQDQEFLAQHAKNTWNDFYRPYRISEGQMYFTEASLKKLRGNGIAVVLLWARVQKNLRDMKNMLPVAPGKETVRAAWTPRMQELAARYNVPLLDMNYGESISCDLFYDSSHLASACFPEFSQYIMSHVKKAAVP